MLEIHAQTAFLQDINGRPFFTINYTDYEGSPYLINDWRKGTVVAKTNGKTYELAKMRYDIYKDEIEYEENQKPYRFANEITEFQLAGRVFRRNFPNIETYNARSFYEVLYDGKIKVLKHYLVKVQSEKPYNSATEIKRFVKDEYLFLMKDSKMIKLKRDKKAVLDLLADKQSDLENFIKSQKLKLSKEDDIIALVEHYEHL